MQAYVISLPKNKANWDSILENIRSNGVDNPQIFQGIIGKNLPNKQSDEYKQFGDPYDYLTLFTYFNILKEKYRRFHAQLTSWGAVGCYLSHVILWQMLAASQTDSAFVIFEDDVTFKASFKQHYLTDILPNIPSNADMVLLDVLKVFSKPNLYNEYFDRISGLFFGTHAYIITKQGAVNLLKKIFPIEIQIDSYVSKYAELNDLNLYLYKKKIASQGAHVSSIQDMKKLNLFMVDYWQYIILLIIILSVLCFVYMYRAFRNSPSA